MQERGVRVWRGRDRRLSLACCLSLIVQAATFHIFLSFTQRQIYHNKNLNRPNPAGLCVANMILFLHSEERSRPLGICQRDRRVAGNYPCELSDSRTSP
ncbi:hypothetical protein GGR52DRAFT_563134 [Hypoxylon sp. FL1284]|nr:hypothetical protein GGR52DRAFT_563134 [Hypoxylon sp. FL1284]